MGRGRRIAFDPVDGRLWAVCESCHRWSLVPVEDRHGALVELERLARDHGRQVAHTANISLLQAGPLTLVRVGRSALAEQAWWRYGRELRRRRASFESAGSRVASATVGVLAYAGDALGVVDAGLPVHWADTPMADILRWRRFGWAAWRGRETCPYCHSTLRALRYDLSWWAYPVAGEGGRVGLAVPCQRCDPWTPEKVYELQGDAAENALRRVLAYQNVSGASERRIAEASRAIEHAGSAGAFALEVTGRRQTLWRMGSLGTLALEIALGESVERRMLDVEAKTLEWIWRREEELAEIMDRELTPGRVLEDHLRRLPIRLRPRPSPRLGPPGS